MPEERMNSQPQNDENVERTESTENANEDRFESDTQKIIRRHLENKDDIITDEDIAGVRIGMTPEFDEATAARFDDDDAREDAEENLLGETEGEMNKDENLDEGQVTPWDTIDPAK